METAKPNHLEPSSQLPQTLRVEDWGVIEYNSALNRQMDLVDLVHQELARETLIFCTHPAVVTLGRGTREGDVFAWTGDTVEVNRGGRATYHGPNQLICYPILDLSHRGRDLHRYMRSLEQAIVATLAEFGITASGRAEANTENLDAQDATGVWIGSRKIASIGIGVRKWTSFHGLALNVDRDEKAFQGLKPCGFSAETMISMEEILGSKVERAKVLESLKIQLSKFLAAR